MSVVVEHERGSAQSHYDLLARLAAGGMAEIFLARAKSLAGLERYVVLKRVRPEYGDDPRWVRMFLDEARLAAQLQHPNIAQVFDLGQIGDDYFYTMEYVHGKDLLEILSLSAERNLMLPVNVTLAIATGAAEGLAHAHGRHTPDGRSLGIVHRDISPSNVMVSFEGAVKVVDFGVAKARFRSTETEAGTIMGKVAYLSPEQCRTGAVDHRSDIFSLGIVLYEMLTSQRAFKRDSDYETLRAVMQEMPTRPSKIVPNLPHGIDQVVMRALAKDPDDRYESCAKFLDALEELVEVEGLTITSGVLRRYMHGQFGERLEPWRVFDDVELLDDNLVELVEPNHTRTIAGLPLDADAAQVPMLQATGMIDISALFSREMVSKAMRPRAPSNQDEDEDLPTPLSIPAGSVPSIHAPPPSTPPPGPRSMQLPIAPVSAQHVAVTPPLSAQLAAARPVLNPSTMPRPSTQHPVVNPGPIPGSHVIANPTSGEHAVVVAGSARTMSSDPSAPHLVAGPIPGSHVIAGPAVAAVGSAQQPAVVPYPIATPAAASPWMHDPGSAPRSAVVPVVAVPAPAKTSRVSPVLVLGIVVALGAGVYTLLDRRSSATAATVEPPAATPPQVTPIDDGTQKPAPVKVAPEPPQPQPSSGSTSAPAGSAATGSAPTTTTTTPPATPNAVTPPTTAPTTTTPPTTAPTTTVTPPTTTTTPTTTTPTTTPKTPPATTPTPPVKTPPATTTTPPVKTPPATTPPKKDPPKTEPPKAEPPKKPACPDPLDCQY